MQRLVVVITYTLLAGAIVLAAVALYNKPDFDRASIALSLGAAVTGLVLSRWVAERERRTELLRALAHELFTGLNIFATPEMQSTNPPHAAFSYPRLPTGCLDSVLGSGLFTTKKDRKLLKYMYDWRQRATEFNDKLNFTQHYGLTNDSTALAAFHHNVTASNTALAARDALNRLSDHLVTRYKRETGISADTMLFATDAS